MSVGPFLAVLRGPEWRAVGPAVSVHTGLSRHSVFALLSRGTPRYNGNVFSSNVLFVMSLMEESANAELQGRPGGARRCARSAAGHRSLRSLKSKVKVRYHVPISAESSNALEDPKAHSTWPFDLGIYQRPNNCLRMNQFIRNYRGRYCNHCKRSVDSLEEVATFQQ
ncbi:hypothetical protein EAG_07418 [Camponotus floridanus]|uniref:Uncharacterized protein n=1 Tax=Camponotus floridanus TaxID=104421 RepID=E2ASH4_CAMFO|nr:hypothetical protein EAG_07418 [Camponotus floridanus]